MKKRTTIGIFKHKQYIYVLDNVKIKSDFELDEQKVIDIFNTIEELMKRPFYGAAYQVARKIFYIVQWNKCEVKFYAKKKKFLVKIGKVK